MRDLDPAYVSSGSKAALPQCNSNDRFSSMSRHYDLTRQAKRTSYGAACELLMRRSFASVRELQAVLGTAKAVIRNGPSLCWASPQRGTPQRAKTYEVSGAVSGAVIYTPARLSSLIQWWALGLNLRPLPCEGNALPERSRAFICIRYLRMGKGMGE